MNRARAYFAAAVLNEMLYVIGGKNLSFFNTYFAEKYNDKEKCWTVISLCEYSYIYPVNPDRICVVDGRIYMIKVTNSKLQLDDNVIIESVCDMDFKMRTKEVAMTALNLNFKL